MGVVSFVFDLHILWHTLTFFLVILQRFCLRMSIFKWVLRGNCWAGVFFMVWLHLLFPGSILPVIHRNNNL